MGNIMTMNLVSDSAGRKFLKAHVPLELGDSDDYFSLDPGHTYSKQEKNDVF